MRTLGLLAIAVTGLGLSGCSQLSDVFKKRPHYHADDGTVVYTETTEAHLRTVPQQPYQFADETYDVDVYDASSSYGTPNSTPSYVTAPESRAGAYAAQSYGASQYAGYGVEFFGVQPSYASAVYADPREAEFVMLNGESDISDWKNCEILNRGYLFISEYDFSLNPGFEVCMRNKGYVLASEFGPTNKQKLSAQTARLRSAFQSTPSVSTYSGYFR